MQLHTSRESQQAKTFNLNKIFGARKYNRKLLWAKMPKLDLFGLLIC